MYIVMVSAECAPVAKAGGLGDMVMGLSRELAVRGHSVEIVLPKYERMRYQDIWDLQVAYADLWVPWHGSAINTTVWFGHVHGRKCYFVEPHSQHGFFQRDRLYGYPDDAERFAFFCKATLEFLLHASKRPEVIHCHDWQTGLVPVLLCEQYRGQMEHQRVCYTIHNFRHQGVTGRQVLAATGLGRPEHFLHPDRLGDNATPGALNMMKGGIVYSNFVTTVSPHHAGEVRFTDQGHCLNSTLDVHQAKFGGILNGVCYDTWNPEIDWLIPARYSVSSLDVKYANKEVLRERFWLRKTFSPIIGFVGRIDEQKGMHLVHHAILYALSNGAQFVLLGEAGHNPGINRQFWNLKHQLNENPDCHLEIGYSEELCHLVYAGVDLLVVPSLFEPCGLAPMIALRYGTVPVVRAIGGMVDTVCDRDFSMRPEHERNGYVFHQADTQALESALWRALGLWNSYPCEFRTLMSNGMRQDFSWARPGHDYVNVYEHIRHK
ncbi:MAG TPA: glycogen synthase [Candidatus Dormibacteraeota bacterium]